MWTGMLGYGGARFGRHGEARLVQAGPGVDWRVMARFGRQGEARHGQVWLAGLGSVRFGRQGKARHGKARHGRPRNGMAG